MIRQGFVARQVVYITLYNIIYIYISFACLFFFGGKYSVTVAIKSCPRVRFGQISRMWQQNVKSNAEVLRLPSKLPKPCCSIFFCGCSCASWSRFHVVFSRGEDSSAVFSETYWLPSTLFPKSRHEQREKWAEVKEDGKKDRVRGFRERKKN